MGIFKRGTAQVVTAPQQIGTDCQLNIGIVNGSGATVTLATDLVGTFQGVEDPALPGRFAIHVTAGGGTGSTIQVTKDGYVTVSHRLADSHGAPFPLPFSGAWELQGETLQLAIPAFPPADLIAPEIRPFDGTDDQGNLVHTTLPPEALAVAYPPARNVDYFRGDFGGVTTPLAPPFVPGANTTPPNMWMTFQLPAYVGLRMPDGSDCVEYFLTDYVKRGYTHLHLQRTDDIPALVHVAQRARAYGLFVTYWAALKSDPIRGGWAAYQCVRPALDALLDAQLVDVPIVGGECNLALDPPDLIDIVQQLGPYLRSRGVSRLGLHFTSNYGSYEPNGMDRLAWWRQMAAAGVTHLCWQGDPNQSAGMMGAMLYEARMYLADSGVVAVAFETIAENQLYGRASETDGRRIGWELCCCTRLNPAFPPVMGSMNGHVLSDAAGNPVITS